MTGRAGPPLLVLILLLAGAPGCSYLAARGRDLSDIVSVGVSPGSGIGARMAATQLVELEVGAQKDESLVGAHQRNFRWVESSYGLPFSPFRTPSVQNEPVPPRHWYDFFTTSRHRTLYPTRPKIEDRRYTLFVRSTAEGQRWVDLFNIDLGATFLAGGFELTLSPGELVDFLLGWFGLDLGGDDAVRFAAVPPPQSPPPQSPPIPPPSTVPPPGRPGQ
jgi:hypothetical protein